MKLDEIEPARFHKEIKKLSNLNNKGRHFEVIMLSVQLLEIMATWVILWWQSENLESLHKYCDDDEEESLRAIYNEFDSTFNKYRERGAPKIKLLEMLYEEFNAYNDLKVNTAFIHKINRIFSFRNDIARSYYYKSNSNKVMKLRASECLDVLGHIAGSDYFL